MKFCGAVARALLIGVELGGLDGVRVGNGSKKSKLKSRRLALGREMWYHFRQ